MREVLGSYRVAVETAIVLILIGGRALLWAIGVTGMSTTPLISSVISGGMFVMGLVVAGTLVDYRDAERLACLSARAPPDGDRQRAKNCRHGGHHDRPEAHQGPLIYRLGGRLTLIPLSLEREVDHHDRVFLDDANQHDQANERVDAEVHIEKI